MSEVMIPFSVVSFVNILTIKKKDDIFYSSN